MKKLSPKNDLNPRSYTQSQKIFLRSRISHLLEEGFSPSAISRLLNVSRPTIYLWKNRILHEGSSTIFKEKKRSGRPQKITPLKIKHILQDLKLNHTQNKEGSIRKIANRQKVSHSSVWRIKQSHLPSLSFSSSKKEKNNKNKKENSKLIFNTNYQKLPITLNNLSHQTKIPTSTLSLALRNDPKIPLKTRTRIQKLARKLDYYPDPALARLSNLRWKKQFKPNSIAFLCDSELLLSSKPFTHLLYETVQKTSHTLGYTVEHFHPQHFPNLKTLNRILLYRGFQGIILHHIHDPERIRKTIQWQRFAAVSLFQMKNFTHKVGMNYFSKFKITWEKLLSYGYQRIGFIVAENNLDRWGDQNTLAAFYLKQHQTPSSQRIPFFEGHPKNNAHAFKKWLTTHRPDVLLLTHLSAPQDFMDLGFSVPRDFALASIHRNEKTDPFLAGTEVPIQSIASQTITFLDQQIRNNQFGIPSNPFYHHFTPHWHEAPSLPRKKK